MRKHNTSQLIVVGSLLVAGLGIAGTATATADDAAKPAQRSAPTAVAADSARQSNITIEHQRGIVLEGSGLAGDLPVAVTVYENSLHGNSIQVVLGDPDNGGQIGYVEQAQPFVVDGISTPPSTSAAGRSSSPAPSSRRAGPPRSPNRSRTPVSRSSAKAPTPSCSLT